jgi:tetratricopeptide (TPR) repeat protein
MVPTHRRARYALALALAEQGQLAEAERILQGLVLPQHTPRDLWRNLCQVQLQAGRVADARASLDRIDVSDWTPIIAYQNLELLRAEKRFDEFERALETSQARFGETPFLRAAAAYRGAAQLRYKEALELAERAVAMETDPFYRDLARAMQFQLECDALQSSDSTLLIPDAERPKHTELLARGERLVGELRHPRALSTASWALGRQLLRLGDLARGLEHLDRAMELTPWNPGPRYDYVVWLRRYAEAGSVPLSEQRYLLSLARQRIGGLLENAQSSRLSPGALDEVHMAAVVIAVNQSDYRLAEPWLDQAISRFEREGNPVATRLKAFREQCVLGQEHLLEQR